MRLNSVIVHFESRQFFNSSLVHLKMSEISEEIRYVILSYFWNTYNNSKQREICEVYDDNDVGGFFLGVG